MEQGKNRVFINPNFKKKIVNNVPVKQVTVMHVNPNFCLHAQNASALPKTKIYVNPNFVRPNEVNKQIPCVNNMVTTQYAYGKPTPLMDSSNTLNAPVSTPTKIGDQSLMQIKLPMVQPFQTHSRYSLVRQKATQEPPTNISKTQTNTVKINKYKSIKMTNIKKKLDSNTPLEKISHFKISNNLKSIIRVNNNQKVISKTPTSHNNRYRFVKPAVNIVKPQFKTQTSITLKKVPFSRTRIKVGVYKKNNIPCPQYRKYGKCLRESYGKCEFLHDRKHVAICRKFVNGVCHNEKCLLSHELSDKKMPTCYFYLKGMCTKEGCPYLHVKLNDKAKICIDFARGYCEKGDKCLNKHIAVTSNVDVKRSNSMKKLSLQKLTKYKLEKNKIKSNTSNTSTQKRKSKIQRKESSPDKSNDSSGRYYKESVPESNVSEDLKVIKPTRCKLGILPSFIQL